MAKTTGRTRTGRGGAAKAAGKPNFNNALSQLLNLAPWWDFSIRCVAAAPRGPLYEVVIWDTTEPDRRFETDSYLSRRDALAAALAGVFDLEHPDPEARR